ncbi:MAG: flagellar assembly protein FliX [Sphingomonas sp.]
MRIENLSPMLARSLLAALPKVVTGFPKIGEEPGAQPMPHMTGPNAVPMPSVQMLVTLSAADPGIERRRKLAQDADRGIDALDRLHKELVAGVVSPQRLQEIVDWSQSFETPDDPVLASLLADIDLRVRVELAKHDILA